MKTHDEVVDETQSFLQRMGMSTPKDYEISWQGKLQRWYNALEVDILWLAVWFAIIGYILFIAFDVTSTFPASVKWAIASGSLFLLAVALSVLSIWRRQRTYKG